MRVGLTFTYPYGIALCSRTFKGFGDGVPCCVSYASYEQGILFDQRHSSHPNSLDGPHDLLTPMERRPWRIDALLEGGPCAYSIMRSG